MTLLIVVPLQEELDALVHALPQHGVGLRGITDTANHSAPADFAVNLGAAMASVAAALVRWRRYRTL